MPTKCRCPWPWRRSANPTVWVRERSPPQDQSACVLHSKVAFFFFFGGFFFQTEANRRLPVESSRRSFWSAHLKCSSLSSLQCLHCDGTGHPDPPTHNRHPHEWFIRTTSIKDRLNYSTCCGYSYDVGKSEQQKFDEESFWSGFWGGGVKQRVNSVTVWIKRPQKLSLASKQLNPLMTWVACLEDSGAVIHGYSAIVKSAVTLTSVFHTCHPGLWVHREAGGDSGEASDLWPRGTPTCEVPLRLCTEPVRRATCMTTNFLYLGERLDLRSCAAAGVNYVPSVANVEM